MGGQLQILNLSSHIFRLKATVHKQEESHYFTDRTSVLSAVDYSCVLNASMVMGEKVLVLCEDDAIGCDCKCDLRFVRCADQISICGGRNVDAT